MNTVPLQFLKKLRHWYCHHRFSVWLQQLFPLCKSLLNQRLCQPTQQTVGGQQQCHCVTRDLHSMSADNQRVWLITSNFTVPFPMQCHPVKPGQLGIALSLKDWSCFNTAFENVKKSLQLSVQEPGGQTRQVLSVTSPLAAAQGCASSREWDNKNTSSLKRHSLALTVNTNPTACLSLKKPKNTGQRDEQETRHP